MKPDTKLEVMTCCLPRHLPVARLTVDGILKNIHTKTIYVATRADAFKECRRILGSDVELLDERELTGGMSITDLRLKNGIEGFPARAGWYLQQFVKLGYALLGNAEDYYLIWDCDTIPLRPITFFTSEGLPLYTMAEEQHLPYFETYKCLFGYMPEYAGSFISQHMIVNKAIAREMLGEISARYPDESSWSWAIINHLAPANSPSVFSEYETYGNYVKSKYPDRIVLRHMSWLREGAKFANTTHPSRKQLAELGKLYDFAAFETWQLSKIAKGRQRITGFLSSLLPIQHGR